MLTSYSPVSCFTAFDVHCHWPRACVLYWRSLDRFISYDAWDGRWVDGDVSCLLDFHRHRSGLASSAPFSTVPVFCSSQAHCHASRQSSCPSVLLMLLPNSKMERRVSNNGFCQSLSLYRASRRISCHSLTFAWRGRVHFYETMDNVLDMAWHCCEEDAANIEPCWWCRI